jgi:outer membrane receptor protein involved in Fe transport
LFWPGLGNNELVPESGYTYELGIKKYLDEKRNLKFGFDLFLNDLDNWIIWLPNEQNIWRPQNARKINTYGAEVSFSYQLEFDKIKINNVLNYYYTRSRIKEQQGQSIDLSDKQRIYIPLHKLHHGLDIGVSKFTFKYLQSLTSKRYTNQTNTSFLNAFYKADLKLKWELKGTEKLNASLFASVHNIWNTDYELIPFFAMPGRHYSLKTIIKF